MIFRAEVTLSGIAVTGSVGILDITTTEPAQYFVAADATHQFGWFWAKWQNRYLVEGSPVDEWQTKAFPIWAPNTTDAPYALELLYPDDLGGFAFLLEEADGQNGAAYDAGGTLAIEKDSEAQTISFICPLGTVTYDWNHEVWTDNLGAGNFYPVTASVMTADAMGHELFRSSSVADESELALWGDFYTREDGDIFQGAALSSSDPGGWTGWIAQSAGGGGGVRMDDDDTQLTSRYQTGWHYVNATDFPRRTGAQEYRRWVQPAMVYGGIDLTVAEEHALLFRAGALAMNLACMKCWRSHDGGRTWTMAVVYEQTGETFTSPSVTWWAGRLMVVWSHNTDIMQATSYNGGVDFEMPVTLPYTGSFPRHIMHPKFGLYLYFFFDGTDLMVARSSDYGSSFWDGTPVTVESGLVAQQIDAEFAFDGSVLVTFFDAGAWMQKRSWDGGLNWE